MRDAKEAWGGLYREKNPQLQHNHCARRRTGAKNGAGSDGSCVTGGGLLSEDPGRHACGRQRAACWRKELEP